MRTHVSTAVAVTVALACAGSTLIAQEKPAPRPDVPLQVQVVISRYLGDKRVSSLPYTLSMSSERGGQANLRLNGEVPVPTTVFTPGDGSDAKPATTPLTSFTYRTLGTNINLQSVASSEGRFGLNVTVSENWVQPAGAGDKGTRIAPSFGNYQSQNTVHVRDGETAQFTAATDRITGEVIRVEVTARVLK